MKGAHTRSNFSVRFWFGLAVAALALGLPPAARAATNVVPNPGFEQGGCGSTSVICGWKLMDNSSGTCVGAGACTYTTMYQDTANPHSGSASMSLTWATDFSDGWGGVEAGTDPAFCTSIGPGAHSASFWYGHASTDGYLPSVSMGAAFYQTPDCTGTASNAWLGDSASDAGWKQVSGVLVAPAGTQSALFLVDIGTQCDYASGCSVAANFDDLDVEDAVVATPAISSFTPTSGPVGTSVDIRGANLTGASSVTFDGAAASFTVDSDSEIDATVPSGATSGPISVTTPGGTGSSDASFEVTPTISSFTPVCGPAGASVDILGSNFTAATSVTFNGTAASFTVDSDSEIHATVPGGAMPGPISVTTPAGTGSSSSSFTGLCPSPAPTITSFTPASGPVGTSVAITGSDFTGATSVTFTGTPASFTVNSSTSITATVPSGATTGPIAVTTANGTGTSSSSFTVVPDTPPTAAFTVSCTGLTCSFEGGASSDLDGTIQTYGWDFGDGTSGSGRTVSHTFARAGSYTVTLMVTDNEGATAGTSKAVNPISLTARGYKQNGEQKVDLAWNGVAGTSYDLYRNGARIATVQATVYTDNLNRKGSATYTYRVCTPASSTCSNEATVSF
jgi:PKD repeat protein